MPAVSSATVTLGSLKITGHDDCASATEAATPAAVQKRIANLIGISSCLCHRQREIEFGTAVRRTLRPDPAAMCFHNSLCNRQSKPCPELCRRFGLPVPVKNVVKVLWRDSRAGIRDRKADV